MKKILLYFIPLIAILFLLNSCAQIQEVNPVVLMQTTDTGDIINVTPGSWSSPVSINAINNVVSANINPVFRPGTDHVYFSRNDYKSTLEMWGFEIYYYDISDDAVYQTGLTNVHGMRPSDLYDTIVLNFSSDGNTMYLASNSSNGHTGDSGWQDIYSSTWSTSWSTPTKIVDVSSFPVGFYPYSIYFLGSNTMNIVYTDNNRYHYDMNTNVAVSTYSGSWSVPVTGNQDVEDFLNTYAGNHFRSVAYDPTVTDYFYMSLWGDHFGSTSQTDIYVGEKSSTELLTRDGVDMESYATSINSDYIDVIYSISFDGSKMVLYSNRIAEDNGFDIDIYYLDRL